jgi:hypothetical protein
MADISNAQCDEVACSELAVEAEVEQSELSCPALQLQSHSNRPNVLRRSGDFCPTSLPLFQGAGRVDVGAETKVSMEALLTVTPATVAAGTIR